MAIAVPPPLPSLADGREDHAECARWARWYERELGWATEGTAPVRLLTGLRFDVLEVPAAVGRAALRRVGRTGPVALTGARMGLLVAAGSAEELPGLLDWLEWGGVALSLTAIGTGGRITAPTPPGRTAGRSGAAVWLRPPGRGTRRAGAPGPRRPREQGWGCSRSRTDRGRGGHGKPPGPVDACPNGAVDR